MVYIWFKKVKKTEENVFSRQNVRWSFIRGSYPRLLVLSEGGIF